MRNEQTVSPVAARACPVCGMDSAVYNTRERSDGTIVRCRRCLSCGKRWATTESFERYLRKHQYL